MKSPGKRGKVKRCRRESEELWHLDREEARVRRLSGREATSGCVLSERHPVAAGLMNTSVFVIIPHRNTALLLWNLGFAGAFILSIIMAT